MDELDIDQERIDQELSELLKQKLDDIHARYFTGDLRPGEFTIDQYAKLYNLGHWAARDRILKMHKLGLVQRRRRGHRLSDAWSIIEPEVNHGKFQNPVNST